VIEADGGVYPCDFYVTDEWYLGNINEAGFEQLKHCEKARSFEETSKHVDTTCTRCDWANLYRGGCRRLRGSFFEGKPVLNYYCESYREFFDYSYKRLQQFAAVLLRSQSGYTACRSTGNYAGPDCGISVERLRT